MGVERLALRLLTFPGADTVIMSTRAKRGSWKNPDIRGKVFAP